MDLALPRPPVERQQLSTHSGVRMSVHRRAGRAGPRPRRNPTVTAHRAEPDPSPRRLWAAHGASLFALARALLGDGEAARDVVCSAMADLYDGTGPRADTTPETLRRAAAHLYHRCQGDLDRPAAAAASARPAAVRLGELPTVQRAALALCLYGGHSYQLAAARLGLPAEVVADLLRTGLRELRRP